MGDQWGNAKWVMGDRYIRWRWAIAEKIAIDAIDDLTLNGGDKMKTKIGPVRSGALVTTTEMIDTGRKVVLLVQAPTHPQGTRAKRRKAQSIARNKAKRGDK